MTDSLETRIKEIMQRPYHVDVHGTPDEGYLASVREFDGCMTAADTPVEALELVEEAMAAWLESVLDRGLPVPDPEAEGAVPKQSGKLLLRMPRSLHGRLAQRAAAEGVSINQLALSYIAEGMGATATLPE